jgi:hypothetical protein
MNSRDDFTYDLKSLMFYSSTKDIYLGFRVVDGSASTNIRYMKFRDINPPVVHWARTSVN